MNRFLTTFCAIVSMTCAAAAQEAGDTSPAAPDGLINGAQVGDWTVACEALGVNRTSCALTQVRVRSEGGALLAAVVAAPLPDDADGAILTVRVPAQAWLAAGLALRANVEGVDPIEMAWQVCGPELCEAAARLDAAQLSDITDAGVAVLGYAPRVGAEPLVLTIPMNGLTEGLAGLRG